MLHFFVLNFHKNPMKGDIVPVLFYRQESGPSGLLTHIPSKKRKVLTSSASSWVQILLPSHLAGQWKKQGGNPGLRGQLLFLHCAILSVRRTLPRGPSEERFQCRQNGGLPLPTQTGPLPPLFALDPPASRSTEAQRRRAGYYPQAAWLPLSQQTEDCWSLDIPTNPCLLSRPAWLGCV